MRPQRNSNRHLNFTSFTILILSSFSWAQDYQVTNSYHTDERGSLLKMAFIQANARMDSDLGDEDEAMDYLISHHGEYGLPQDMSNLFLTEIKESPLGFHYHYQQKQNGFKVHTGELIVTLSRATGKVAMVYNNTWPVPANKRGSSVNLDLNEAYTLAWNHLRVHGALMAAPAAEMVPAPRWHSCPGLSGGSVG